MASHPVDIHVGKKLRSIRLVRGIVQENLGKMVNLTTQQIQKYEKGQNRISASRLYEFSVILNVPITYFFANMSNEEKIKREILKNTEGINQLEDMEMYNNPNELFSSTMSDSISSIMPEDIKNCESSKNKYASNILNAFFSIKENKIRERILQLIKVLSK